MAATTQTSQQYFKIHQAIFYAFLAGQILFGIAAFIVHSANDAAVVDQELSDIFICIVPIIIVVDFVAGNFVYKQLLKKAKSKALLKDKISAYTTVTLVRMAFAEGASLFTIAIYLITANVIFAGCAAVLIVVFFTFKPSKEKTIMELELNHADTQAVNDPNAVIAEVSVKR